MTKVEQLVNDLQAALGAKLKSVVLYGSAAAGDFVPGVSGHDILIVVEQLSADDLAALTVPLARWEHEGNPLPQLFTSAELTASTDVFPIELLDMQQSRRVLFGADPLAEVRIDMQHYRMQLERDLKTRLLLLRRKYLACGGNADRISHLMIASVSTFLVLMRAALRLYNVAVPVEKADALEQLASHIQFDPQPFRAVLKLKGQKQAPPRGEVQDLFRQYLSAIEHVVHAVDRHLSHSPNSSENSHG
jgi:hypothetical protein